MEPTIKQKLTEYYYGIVAFGRLTYANFGVIDFAGLAASAINLLIKRGEVYSFNKSEYSRYMVSCFNRDIGGVMRDADINVVVNYMSGVNDIDSRMGGIEYAITMSR